MMDTKGALPILAVLVIIGIVLLLAGWIIIALTMKSMIAILLIGAGVYLLIRPQGLTGQSRTLVPIALILIGVFFYAGVFDAILG